MKQNLDLTLPDVCMKKEVKPTAYPIIKNTLLEERSHMTSLAPKGEVIFMIFLRFLHTNATMQPTLLHPECVRGGAWRVGEGGG